ncbi:hypothetical protein H4Q26_003145 [Puccinia striiformis f. sp. tritici PST-130]|nr:hypothetical protein H4Q26_003145 [Puccinia striiformis f. sp. tritici PST-130]
MQLKSELEAKKLSQSSVRTHPSLPVTQSSSSDNLEQKIKVESVNPDLSLGPLDKKRKGSPSSSPQWNSRSLPARSKSLLPSSSHSSHSLTSSTSIHSPLDSSCRCLSHSVYLCRRHLRTYLLRILCALQPYPRIDRSGSQAITQDLCPIEPDVSPGVM